MSAPTMINHMDFMELLKNYDRTFVRTYSQPTNNGIFVKIGRTAGKATSFFKKSETKASALIAHWSVETLIFISVSLSISSIPLLMLITGWYLFETYAIFSAIMALTKY